jgi:putative transcriptional regulator
MKNEIEKYRKQANLTQGELAGKIGWGASRLSNYERGFRDPCLDDCRLIVKTLNQEGVSVSLDGVFPPEKNAA